MKNMTIGQRYHFWLTDKDGPRFCLPLHKVIPGGKVQFILEWKNKDGRRPVYFTVDRSHVTARATR